MNLPVMRLKYGLRRMISLSRRLSRWCFSCGRILVLRIQNPALQLPYSTAVGKGVVISVPDGGYLEVGEHSSLVLRGATMGDRSTLGAHGLLNGNIPENCLAVGAPAKVVGESSS